MHSRNFWSKKGFTEPKFKGFSTQSLYLTMRDKTKIAVDVVLPKNLKANKVPTLIIQTRYWRAYDLRAPFKWFKKIDELLQFFTSFGYAIVLVDVRGTGASYGFRLHPWSRDEILDGGEIIDWVVVQPWSNGCVGAIGVSYLGATAELLAVNNRATLKAVIPMFSQFDLYPYVPFPGGVFNEWFIKQWAFLGSLLDKNRAKEMTTNLYRLLEEKEASLGAHLPKGFRLLYDANELRMGRLALKGVKPVDSDRNCRLLKEAVGSHDRNSNVYELGKGIIFRDDKSVMNGNVDVKIDDFSIHSFKDDIERSKVAIYAWGSWLDAGTADAVISRFLTFDNIQRAVIGPWNHGARFHASPYMPIDTKVDPSEKAQWENCLRFFDHYLKGVYDDEMTEKVLIYYTLGEEKWKRTNVWPPSDITIQRWYLSENFTLSRSIPIEESGFDTYNVDFEATTGMTNRWHTQLGFAVVYLDRAEEDSRILTYTSQPLDEDLEITGHPIITLYVTSTATDGAFFVYLEDVDETGKVTYVTEGQLRAIHRKISTDPPPYKMLVPYHSFKRRDAMPLVPNEIAEITFGLLPTSVLIKKKHRIRVAIAGHDKDTFERIPAEGTPKISVFRNKLHASSIDLPVVKTH